MITDTVVDFSMATNDNVHTISNIYAASSLGSKISVQETTTSSTSSGGIPFIATTGIIAVVLAVIVIVLASVLVMCLRINNRLRYRDLANQNKIVGRDGRS